MHMGKPNTLLAGNQQRVYHLIGQLVNVSIGESIYTSEW